MSATTATRKPENRGEHREAGVLVRMSRQEHAALREAAARRQITATELLREQMLRAIREARA